ncbi:unnamed protein product [Schistocephalus solidus]|uniref:EF-hand domain-containing protein n=1 Tax=Schistocephalus solidus TaxID=70667 RepID=A0A183T6K5_SCHSO|nr:unnamed protein product [Schistocephalus solidus]
MTIWKQVDSDGDLKLDESEYCLAASLAEKVASTGFTLLEVNGLAHALENEANRPFETSSLLDDSRDLLLSPASASLLTPDVSDADYSAAHFKPSGASVECDIWLAPSVLTNPPSPQFCLVPEDSDLVGRGGVDAQQPAMILSEQPYDTDNASLLSDFSFSRLAERSTLAYGAPLFTGEPTGLHSSAVTLPSHSSPDLGGLSGLGKP